MKPLIHFAKHIIALILIVIIMFLAVYGALEIVKELSKPKELPIIDSRTRVVYYGANDNEKWVKLDSNLIKIK